MHEFTTLIDDGFLWSRPHEKVLVVPWGRNGVRVRVTREAEFRDLPRGLLPFPATPEDARGCPGSG